jgi:phosphoribosyl 1,2-cyclic phosphate phosphodiesterase
VKVTFLGTGTSLGVPVVGCSCAVCQSNDERDKRLRSSVLIQVNGLNLVIDAGPDFRQQMLRAKVNDLSAILITHEHYDHISGLDEIRAFNWILQKPIDIYTEARVQQSVKKVFSYVFDEKKYPGIPEMKLHIVDETPFSIDGTKIIPIRGMHLNLPVLGFRIGNFAYLTDIKTLDEKEIEKLTNLDVLVLNALRRESHISHLTLAEAAALIKRINPGKAYLTHISHQMGTYVEISKSLPYSIFMAYDGLEIDL